MTSEARIKELASMLANHPFLGMAVDEINRLEEEAAELRERVENLKGVLQAAQLDLDFVDGLFASDDVALIGNTKSGIWRLDMSNINRKIDTALSKEKLETRSEEE